MREIEITANSKQLSATLFEANERDVLLIIASATGVKQEYYQKFAQFMCEQGVSVITFDYNGIGRSLKQPIQQVRNNASDWGRNDLESVIQYGIQHFPTARKVLLGHSIGGQLIGLAKSAPKIDKILLVASQSGYWKFWQGFERVKMWFNWYVLFPVLISTFGYLYSKKITGMENLPSKVANQWRNWGKHSNYILSDPSIQAFYYEKIKSAITAYSIEDDFFAPKEAVQWMTRQYSQAPKKEVRLTLEDLNTSSIGHFGVFKEKFRDTIWPQFLKEIKH
ncbi:alpha/beta fold hydrolase [Flammeovirga sp. SJP92]|uniref:alpha/beta hydrolase family protein n=1 Tax=Flammeovirga sp. SJP92 TaxID=1775430 RepID=UPI0007887D9D|nr:alpha/beta fold hydrolase [Flammeovirga sp. SJP92]KXX66820.1 hypothetical protein AVL50_30265 [Flammeovirga sp. SJP92]